MSLISLERRIEYHYTTTKGVTVVISGVPAGQPQSQDLSSLSK
jgi:hypothetical protein